MCSTAKKAFGNTAKKSRRGAEHFAVGPLFQDLICATAEFKI